MRLSPVQSPISLGFGRIAGHNFKAAEPANAAEFEELLEPYTKGLNVHLVYGNKAEMLPIPVSQPDASTPLIFKPTTVPTNALLMKFHVGEAEPLMPNGAIPLAFRQALVDFNGQTRVNAYAAATELEQRLKAMVGSLGAAGFDVRCDKVPPARTAKQLRQDLARIQKVLTETKPEFVERVVQLRETAYEGLRQGWPQARLAITSVMQNLAKQLGVDL